MGLLRVQGEVKGGAAAHDAFGPGAAAVAFDDPPDAGQADPVPGNSVTAWSRWNGWNSLAAKAGSKPALSGPGTLPPRGQ
jgi:hypothetical protein